MALGEQSAGKASIEPWSDGELCRGLQVTRKLGRKSRAKVTYALEAGSPHVHVTLEVDWREPEHLLKFHFPTAYAATNARFGAAFGSVLRPQQAVDLVSEARWEVPFSRYLAVFDEGESAGLFVATEAKYGASVRDGDIGISLVRSPLIPGFEGRHDNAWPVHLSRLKDKPPHCDIGSHVIKIIVGRYDIGLPRERQPAAIADVCFTDPVLYRGEPIPPVLEGIDRSTTLVPAWVIPQPGKAWLLRLHEVSGQRGSVRFRLAEGWKAETTALDGSKPVPIARGSLAYTPYQIVTVKISPA